jgi:hypothetical protein
MRVTKLHVPALAVFFCLCFALGLGLGLRSHEGLHRVLAAHESGLATLRAFMD